jgi:hypothetical protein
LNAGYEDADFVLEGEERKGWSALKADQAR